MRRASATVLVVLLAALTAGGCATRNGDLAEFCRILPETESIELLAPELLGTDVPEVERKLDRVAAGLRRLERVAPRTIRSDVARVANFVQRFAHELRETDAHWTGPRSSTPPATVYTYPGGTVSPAPPPVPGAPAPSTTLPPVEKYPYSTDGDYGGSYYGGVWSNPVYRAFYNVSRDETGVFKAANHFVQFAQDRCGKDVVPQGGAPGGSDSGPGGPIGVGPGFPVPRPNR